MQKNMMLTGAACAVVVVAIVIALAVAVRHDSAPLPPPKTYPHRDMLQDTVAIPATQPSVERPGLQKSAMPGNLKITGNVLAAGARIPREHTCNGRNISPSFGWAGAPRGTRSFAVVFEKTDAAAGDVLQWAVYNIPSSMTAIPANLPREASLPDGLAQAMNDTGNIGYVGPCAARGQHNYKLTIFALDIKPALTPGIKRDDLIAAMKDHVLDMVEVPLVHFYRL